MTREINPCAKKVTPETAYEVWQVENHPTYGGRWTWFVLNKYQTPEREASNLFARWYCWVLSPFVSERGEYGDVYVADITDAGATKRIHNPQAQVILFHVHGEKPAADGHVECLDLWSERFSAVHGAYHQTQQFYSFVELHIEISQQDEEEEQEVRVTLLTHGIRPELSVQDVQSSE